MGVKTGVEYAASWLAPLGFTIVDQISEAAMLDGQGSQDCEERFRQCEKISLKETVYKFLHMKDCIHCAITFAAKLKRLHFKAIRHRQHRHVIVEPKQGVEVRCSANYIWLSVFKFPVKSDFKTTNAPKSFGRAIVVDQPI